MDIERHDLASDPPSRQLLERLVDQDRLGDFLNSRSPKFKELNLGARKLTKKEAIDLMMSEPNLIRRPLVVAGRTAVFGFDADAYDKLIPG